MAVLVVVGITGGYLTYTTHVDPGTEIETETVSTWQSTGEFDHQAIVVNGTRAFYNGEWLHNWSAYFTQTTPELEGAFSYTYTATDGGDLNVTVTTSLELRSVTEDGNDEEETIYWQIEREQRQERQRSLSPGETVASPFSVDVNATATEVEQIDENLGGTPGHFEMEVVADVALSGTRNGNDVNTIRTYRLPIDPSDGVYEVGDPGTVQQSDTETREITVQATYGPLRKGGGPALLVAALVGTIALGYATRTGRLAISEHEREWLAFRSDRSALDEWISTGAVGTGARGSTTAETDSLAGLVDVAIDTDSRVIEDSRTRSFYVFADDQRFRFEPPAEPDRERTDRTTVRERISTFTQSHEEETRTSAGHTESADRRQSVDEVEDDNAEKSTPPPADDEALNEQRAPAGEETADTTEGTDNM